MFKNLVKQLKNSKKDEKKNCSYITSPFENDVKRLFLKSLSEDALNLYERKTDVKKFTKLVLSDPENRDYVDLTEKLFDLSENEKFLRDLGL